jgi:hypothetical protein
VKLSEEEDKDKKEVESERKKLEELGVSSTWDLLTKKKDENES